MQEWSDFITGIWCNDIDVRDFIQKNYTLYEGNEEFLCKSTEKTQLLWSKCNELLLREQNGEIQIDVDHISGINNFDPGFIQKDLEIIYGLQTDKPLKRIINPFGGINMVEKSLKAYNYNLDEKLHYMFTSVRKTHNQGVFDVYSHDMKKFRHAGLLTGLPDAYGRGRIIGDYRRIALYGINYLVEKKLEDLTNINMPFDDNKISLKEDIYEQIKSLKAISCMAEQYGFNIKKPAKDAKEAVQFLYFGYLAAVKENNGAAMSLGRISSFLDIYIERDIKKGVLCEEAAQELIDQLVIKLRLVRQLRTPEYDELFAGDPNWITEALGGMGIDNRTLVTKTTYRFIHTLENLGAAPEPNMTILWSSKLPENFIKFCSRISIQTSALQYENDDLMRPIYGDDYGIACCVSAMTLGREMQFFGARCNLAKALLYSINGGIDEILKEKIIPGIDLMVDEVLDYDKVKKSYFKVLDYIAEVYVNTMNIIHFMHDKYAYESSMMALHDSMVKRYMAFGAAGLSCAVDSLSAIKYAKVIPIRENGISIDYKIEGEFPAYGNDDDKADEIAVELVNYFINALRKYSTYKNAEHTLSILTITSNVVYGKKTGSTPDGRKKGEAFAPGANPMHGRDKNGALASLNSVAKIPYKGVCQDGVSNTFTITNNTLGKNFKEKVNNLNCILEGYFVQGAHHLNVNVLEKSVLEDAIKHPEKYPNLTIRVSGYAVNFNKLSEKHKIEILKRTFHEML